MRALLVAGLIAGCGTDPKAIDLAIPGTQVLVTEKVNGGAWKQLAGQFDGEANATTYSIEIGDEYELAVVCIRSGPRDAGQFVAAEVFGTDDDPEVTLGSWKAPNCLLDGSGFADPSADQVTVTGTFDEDLHFSIGRTAARLATANLPFTLSADRGRHDLIAFANSKLLIQRDLQFDGDTTLAPVHVERDGGQMLVVDVNLGEDPDESLFITNRVNTRGGGMYSWQNEDRHGALFAPPEVLAPGDVSHFQVTVLAALDTQQRSVEVANPADLAEVTLLPRIESGTPHEGGVGMTWTAISDFYTTATVATSSSRSVQRVTASRSWLERHGKNELDFDLAVDGYDASWTVQLPLSVELARWNQGRVSSTSYRPVEAM